MNKQREVIYEQRRQVLSGEPFVDDIQEMVNDLVVAMVAQYCSDASYEEAWDLKGLAEALSAQFSLSFDPATWNDTGFEGIKDEVLAKVRDAYQRKEQEFGPAVLRELEKAVMLRVIDTHWKDHLLTMDYLKEGIGLRGYGQKDPLVEYKREGYDLFIGLIERIKVDAIGHLFRIQAVRPEAASPPPPLPRPASTILSAQGSHAVASPVPTARERVGRNDPCPCGSGKKFKKCHGA